MSDQLNSWAEGRFRIRKPNLILNEKEINLTLKEGEEYNGSLILKSSIEDFNLKGNIFCDHPFFSFAQKSFRDNEIELKYAVNTHGLCNKDKIDGNIRIYSNIEIVDIPISLTITEPELTIGNITISNLEEFVSLYGENKNSAADFFFNDKFQRVVLNNSVFAQATYRQIKTKNYRDNAVEAFLYALGLRKKSILSFTENNVINRILAPPDIDRYNIELCMENKGELPVRVSCDESFVELSSDTISTDNFISDRYIFSYTIHPSRLSSGINEARIVFENDLQSLTYKIIVDNSVMSELDKKKLSKKRNLVLVLMNRYLDFRLNKISKEEWISVSYDYVESLEKLDDDMFIRLYKAHLLIVSNKIEEAKNLLFSLEIDDRQDITCKAYFLYLVAFFKEEKNFVIELTYDLNKYRKEKPEVFSLLWFLMYLEDSYISSPSKRYNALKEQYNISGSNVIMLCEASILLNKHPELLSEFGSFEIEVCIFALKRDYISGTFWNAIFHTSGYTRNFHIGVYKLLLEGYERYLTSDMLEGLCAYCVTGGCTFPVLAPIYERAIVQGSKVTGIYEYYLKCLPSNYDRPVIKQALHYFKYRTDISDEDRALLYANIYKFYQNEDIYSEYAESIRDFAIEMLMKRQIDDNSVFLYNNVIKAEDINVTNANDIAYVSRLYLIVVTYDKACSISVLDSRLNTAKTFALNKGRAIIPLCGDDVSIGFDDDKGVFHIDDSFVQRMKLVNRDDLLKAADKCKPTCFEHLLYNNDTISLVLSDEISDEYRRVCLKKAVDYYTDNPYDDNAFEFIEKADIELLDVEARLKIATVYVLYNKFNTAVRIMSGYGYYGIDYSSMTLLCEELIKLDDNKELQALSDDSWFVDLCRFLYIKGVRSEKIVKFLSFSMNGTIEEMLSIWNSCRVIKADRSMVAERTLVLACYLQLADDDLLDVYEDYTQGKVNRRIALSYLSLMAFDYYIIRNKHIQKKRLFYHIVNYFMNFEALSGVCQLACLDYLSDIKELSGDDEKFVIEVIKNHAAKGMYFDIFEAFTDLLNSRRVELIGLKRQRRFVMHIDETGKMIFIKYRLLNRDGEPIFKDNDMDRSNMSEIYPCIYVKDFILFAGESVNYVVMQFANEQESELYEQSVKAKRFKVNSVYKDRYDMVEEMLLSTSNNSAYDIAKQISVFDSINKDLFLVR